MALLAKFFRNNELVAEQGRITDPQLMEYQRFSWIPKQPQVFWNEEAITDPNVLSGENPLVITEGVLDAVAAIEAGYPYAVSLPFGATLPRKDDQDGFDPDNDGKFTLLWELQDQLKKIKRFVLAVDGDEAGKNLYRQLVERLGAERCRFVSYPDGCKDLNDVLEQRGGRAVLRVIHEAKQHPIKGLYDYDHIPEYPELEKLSTGFKHLDPLFPLVKGALTVLTGWPNHGKTSLLEALVAHQIGEQDRVLTLASFETPAKPQLIRQIAKAIIRKNKSKWTAEDKQRAHLAMKKNLKFIVAEQDSDDAFTLDDLLEAARVSVVRDGAEIIILDPWNDMDHPRHPNETLTEYVSRAIRTTKRFARQYNVAFIIVAHPSKPPFNAKPRPASLYDISDSAHWQNKADLGGSYYRPNLRKNVAEFHCIKSRNWMPGRRGVCGFKFEDGALIDLSETELEGLKGEVE
ncbi:MAG: bifunctional DNA primase/helicase [Pseudomonadota bacterium]